MSKLLSYAVAALAVFLTVRKEEREPVSHVGIEPISSLNGKCWYSPPDGGPSYIIDEYHCDREGF